MKFHIFLYLLLFLSGTRFITSVSKSGQGWTGETQIEKTYLDQTGESRTKRRWGPMFFLSMKTLNLLIKDPATRSFIIRVSLIGMYAAMAWMLMRLFAIYASIPTSQNLLYLQTLFGVLALNSAAGLYAIAASSAEVLTGFCIVRHFYSFVKKRYWDATFVICFGVYFKLYPIVFLFPYLLLSLLSKDLRKYVLCVLVSALLIAVISVPITGWALGFFYPLSLVFSASSDSSLTPALSKEVFAPLFSILRLLTGFKVDSSDQVTTLTRVLAPLFTLLMFSSLGVLVLWMKRRESLWSDGARGRYREFLIFQSIIGFLMLSFSLDVSLMLLLLVFVSLYAPIWLWHKPSLFEMSLFGLGTILVGNLLPLSSLIAILPLEWFDSLAMNPIHAMSPHEKYLWYQIPLIGLLLIAASFILALAKIRREPLS